MVVTMMKRTMRMHAQDNEDDDAAADDGYMMVKILKGMVMMVAMPMTMSMSMMMRMMVVMAMLMLMMMAMVVGFVVMCVGSMARAVATEEDNGRR